MEVLSNFSFIQMKPFYSSDNGFTTALCQAQKLGAEQKETIDIKVASVYSLLEELTFRRIRVVITRATEYAVRTVVFLAQQPKNEIVLKKDICRTQEVTPAFLTKILQPLIKAGIVSSQRGVGGGFLLARDPNQITLLDILQAEEGQLKLNHCLVDTNLCHRDSYCSAHEVWYEAQNEMAEVLRRYTVADMVRRQTEKLTCLKHQATATS
jgi:Rrf2 family transcriptional regulator, iron-sulfur cluster assembly transcription factor